ncbi:MAG TPA: serine/threonine-protein kinase [Waterburya sp.]|jgi:serine/threonine protein kinase
MPTSTPKRRRSARNRVSYCINFECEQRENPAHLELCQACGTPLLLKNRYRLISPLRSLSVPGHAELFEVEDLGVEAAIGSRYKVVKILKANDTTLVRLFKQEADSLKKLNHAGIPKIQHGDGYFTISLLCHANPLHCLVMEKIEGENLHEWVGRTGPISQEEALNWLKQLLEILDYLHQNQYFHRDIKPSNIIRKPTGQLVLIDFGTVREITQTYIVKVSGQEDITCIFSAGYTPEEVIHGKAVPQSDFYALGRTFVYLLTGKSPLKLQRESEQFNWRESAPQVSPPLADWIDYLMAPSPIHRPPNTSFILHCLEGKSIDELPRISVETPGNRTDELPSFPTSWWLVILNFVLFSILLVTGLLWWQSYQKYRENQWQVPHPVKSSGLMSNN